MKEKITVIIILTSVIVLLFHHESHNDTITVSNEYDLEVPTPPLELTEHGLHLPLGESVMVGECEIDISITDNLPFKNAFIHFRKCLGSNEKFSWNGQEYLTLLAEEVEVLDIQIADTTIVEKVGKNNSEIVAH